VRQVSRVGRLLVLGGDASYALYLSHPFTINVVVIAWQKLHLDAPWLFVLSAVGAAVLVSVAVHLAFERPLTRWLHRRVDGRPARQPALLGAAAVGK
jgi:peptidoglycan/LPS O-acetylase OafA/YrhL